MEKQSSYSQHKQSHCTVDKFSLWSLSSGSDIQIRHDYRGVGLHRRLHLLGDATRPPLGKTHVGRMRWGGWHESLPRDLLSSKTSAAAAGPRHPAAVMCHDMRQAGHELLGSAAGRHALAAGSALARGLVFTGCCGSGTAGTCWPAGAGFHRWAASWCS